MPQRTYYVVLGVAEDESEHGIRSAFRDLAKRYHPDRIGPGGTRAFQEIAEAYNVLADASSRRRYDAEIHHDPPPTPLVDETPVHGSHWPPPEPLIPDRRSLRRDAAYSPATDAMFARFTRNFSGVGIPKAEGLEPLNVHVGISRREAQTGTTVTLGVPVFVRCPSCGGFRRMFGLQCTACMGQGLVETERAVPLAIPPLAGSHAELTVPLHDLGIHNFYVVLNVSVDSALD